MTIKITWYVTDGYSNPGPQYAEIEESDLFEDDMTEIEKEIAIDGFIQEEFLNTVSWDIKEIKYYEN